jgi:ABC-type multidrug transport system fused ATPase/permease subunit
VEFRHVTFGYDPERPVLRDVNLRIEPGEMVALIGPTGAGKTSVVSLLLSYYDPDPRRGPPRRPSGTRLSR